MGRYEYLFYCYNHPFGTREVPITLTRCRALRCSLDTFTKNDSRDDDTHPLFEFVDDLLGRVRVLDLHGVELGLGVFELRLEQLSLFVGLFVQLLAV